MRCYGQPQACYRLFTFEIDHIQKHEEDLILGGCPIFIVKLLPNPFFAPLNNLLKSITQYKFSIKFNSHFFTTEFILNVS